MNNDTAWPGLNAVIHHTLRHHTRITVAEAAQRCRISQTQLCQWAQAQGIPLHVSLHGFMIDEAAIESALSHRSWQSRPRHQRTGKQ